MKKRHLLRPLPLLVLLLIAAMAFLSGCSRATGVKRAERTTTSMDEVEKQIRQTTEQINVTSASLRELTASNQPDLKAKFQEYSKNVEQMQSVGQGAIRQIEQMQMRGQEYFREWAQEGKTYANPQIRQLSAERRAELTQTFAQISQAYTGVRGSLRTYMDNLQDIRTYLSNDLTPAGVQNVSPVAQKTLQQGEQVQQSFQPVLEAINRARMQMAGGGMQQQQQQQPPQRQ